MLLEDEKISEEVLHQVQHFAENGMEPDHIALLMGFDEAYFERAIRDKKTLISKAYRKGIAITSYEILKQEIFFAKKGSPAAIKTYASVIKKQLRHIRD